MRARGAAPPIHCAENLFHVETRLIAASQRLTHAAHALEELQACLARNPEGCPASAARLVVEAAQRWGLVARHLHNVSNDVFSLHEDVLAGLASGALVPEASPARPRIVLAPRPASVRAFLRARLPRVRERISPLLRRRRRTPRPSALSVPPRTAQGRAPPSSSVCPL